MKLPNMPLKKLYGMNKSIAGVDNERSMAALFSFQWCNQ